MSNMMTAQRDNKSDGLWKEIEQSSVLLDEQQLRIECLDITAAINEAEAEELESHSNSSLASPSSVPSPYCTQDGTRSSSSSSLASLGRTEPRGSYSGEFPIAASSGGGVPGAGSVKERSASMRYPAAPGKTAMSMSGALLGLQKASSGVPPYSAGGNNSPDGRSAASLPSLSAGSSPSHPDSCRPYNGGSPVMPSRLSASSCSSVEGLEEGKGVTVTDAVSRRTKAVILPGANKAAVEAYMRMKARRKERVDLVKP